MACFWTYNVHSQCSKSVYNLLFQLLSAPGHLLNILSGAQLGLEAAKQQG